MLEAENPPAYFLPPASCLCSALSCFVLPSLCYAVIVWIVITNIAVIEFIERTRWIVDDADTPTIHCFTVRAGCVIEASAVGVREEAIV